jgi:predicted 3-demethylubiquinone-9 3-methyltransferase (glyoxalase superfamily)
MAPVPEQRRLRVMQAGYSFSGRGSAVAGRKSEKEDSMVRTKDIGKKQIVPCLWFDGKAEEAAKFYVSTIRNSKMGKITRYGEAAAKESGQPLGSVMTVTFTINGQEFMALNGGPQFTFSPAVSFVLTCDTQKEIDRLWDKLSEGGEKSVCGWLKDKYGLSWQVVPAVLEKMLEDKDVKRSEAVMEALIKMAKLDIKALQEAYEKPGLKKAA